jgi:hypothetical protein
MMSGHGGSGNAVGALWEFLASPANREVLAWIGGGVAVAASGVWVIVKHFAGGPVAKAATAPQPRMTAGRDIRIGDVALPRLALGLAALGMLLFAIALLFSPGDTVTNSVTADGDIRDSTINLNSPGAAAPAR